MILTYESYQEPYEEDYSDAKPEIVQGCCLISDIVGIEQVPTFELTDPKTEEVYIFLRGHNRINVIGNYDKLITIWMDSLRFDMIPGFVKKISAN